MAKQGRTYQKIRRYLRKNPNSTVSKIVEDTGLRERQVANCLRYSAEVGKLKRTGTRMKYRYSVLDRRAAKPKISPVPYMVAPEAAKPRVPVAAWAIFGAVAGAGAATLAMSAAAWL